LLLSICGIAVARELRFAIPDVADVLEVGQVFAGIDWQAWK
jgi:hypothetical protein